MKILQDKTLELISPTDALEKAEALLVIQQDEKEVEATHEGTVSEYEYSTKKWQEVINKPAIQMI